MGRRMGALAALVIVARQLGWPQATNEGARRTRIHLYSTGAYARYTSLELPNANLTNNLGAVPALRTFRAGAARTNFASRTNCSCWTQSRFRCLWHCFLG